MQSGSNILTEPSALRPWIVAITGASGTVYGRRLIQTLVTHVPGIKLDVVVSEAALRVMAEEENIRGSLYRLKAVDLLGPEIRSADSSITIHNNKDIGASIASGSYLTSGMVVVPCSMATLGAIAHGIPQNLIHRAADVTIKEQRPLILVPRETPLSAIHLENMLKLSRIGVNITPAMPGFYHQPASISDLVDMMVLRIIDQMKLPLESEKRWGAKVEVKDDNRGSKVCRL